MEHGCPMEPAASAPADGVGTAAQAAPVDVSRAGGSGADVRSSLRLTAAGLRRRLVGGPAPPPPPSLVADGAGPEDAAAPAARANSKADAPDDGGTSGGAAGTTQANEAASNADADNSGDENDVGDRDDEEEDKPSVTTFQALRVARPWLLPRTTRLRTLVLFSFICQVLVSLCTFVTPLLLKYAMD